MKILFLLLSLHFPFAAWASATSADWQACHALAARDLQTCLDQQPNAIPSVQQSCWKQARATLQGCYRSVRAQYAKPTEARRQAEAQAKLSAQSKP